MEIRFLDVGHGFCAYLVADNHNIMLFDCGHKADPAFRPSDYLPRIGCTAIERFFLTNYDEDHISDLSRLRRKLPIQLFHRNKSLTAAQLRALKEEGAPLSDAMADLLNMITEYNHPESPPLPAFSDLTWHTFCNRYPDDFEDTNNLSLVTFLHYRDVHLVIPGDLEADGWRKLLERSNFQEQLRTVNFFVASHHGREGGYCPEVFDYCTPSLVIFSDGPQTYATQEMASAYAQRARGVLFNGSQSRYVLSTRANGTITISQSPTSNWHVQIERS